MCPAGVEGAGQALWPAGTAAEPSARGSVPCHRSHPSAGNADLQFSSLTAVPQTNLEINLGPEHILSELTSFS